MSADTLLMQTISRATSTAQQWLDESVPYRAQINRAVFISDTWELCERLMELLRLEWQLHMDIRIESQIDLADVDWMAIADERRQSLTKRAA